MKKRLLSLFLAVLMIITVVPMPMAFAASSGSSAKMTTVDDIVKTAGKLLGTKYNNDYVGDIQPWPGSITSPTRPKVNTVKETKYRGVDCTGLVWWTTVKLGFWMEGYHNTGSRRYYPFSPLNWKEVIDNSDQDRSPNYFTKDGKVYDITVSKYFTPETKYSWWELSNGRTISPGSIVVAENRHGAFYIGEFFSKDEVVEYLVSLGISEKVAEANTYDQGTGGTHWLIESTARWETWGVVVTNPVSFISTRDVPIAVVNITPDVKASDKIKQIRVLSGSLTDDLDGVKIQVFFGNKALPEEFGADNIVVKEKGETKSYYFKYNGKKYLLDTETIVPTEEPQDEELPDEELPDEELPDDETPKEDYVRLAGETRYETSLSIADALKEELGVEKFDNIIVTNGQNYADALAGAPLAEKLNAPIIVVNSRNINGYEQEVPEETFQYIEENLNPGGKVIILGGTLAVSWNFQEELGNRIGKFNIVRLGGETRYETNLEILNYLDDSETLMVADAYGYADALASSSLGLPILLVDKSTGELSEEQIEYINSKEFVNIYVVGGTAVVPKSIDKQLEKLTGIKPQRLAGKTRYETSMKVADEFFPETNSVVLTYGHNFPDALCGGPLSFNLNAPILLVNEGKPKGQKASNASFAKKYLKKHEIENVFVLGGTSVMSEKLVSSVIGEKK